jgi:hypothetical protein
MVYTSKFWILSHEAAGVLMSEWANIDNPKTVFLMDTCSVGDVGIFQLAYKTGNGAYKKILSQPWKMLLRASTRC